MSPNNATPKKTAASAPVESPPKDLRSHHKARVEQEDLKSISLQSLTYCCYGEYVEVIVSTGDKQKQFMVHKQLLTSHSLFFQKALSGTWVEAKERKVKLPEDDHDTFDVYVNLLYSDQITFGPPSSTDPNVAGGDELETLVNLYVLAGKLQDVKIKNKTLVAILASSKEVRSDKRTYVPGHSVITKVYAGTASESLLRRLIVDLWTTDGTGQYL